MPKPVPLGTFFATCSAARTFLTTQKPAPESWATTACFGVNALAFVDASGRVRYASCPERRQLVKLDTLTVDRLGDNSTAGDRALAFLPGNLPPGIGIADPMFGVRNAAYPISINERQ